MSGTDYSKFPKTKAPISAIILTYNEELNIKHALESVRDWVDEVFIVDSGSDDETLTIAKEYSDKVLTHSL